MPRISSFATAAGVALLGIGGWGCDPIVTIFDDVEQPQYYQAAKIDPPASKDTLTVMTWNIKYGGGAIDFWWACYDDRVLMTEDEVLGNLEVLAEKIRAVDPDILLLQEVDVDSKRSAYVDQMQYLLDNTALNYGVYASMWRTQFAPSDGLGRTDIGPAILARWPLGEAERIALALRTDQDAVTKYFYLRRCIVKANLQLPGRDDFYLVNVHTSAWQAETKVKHIDRFKAELDLIDAGGGLFVAGGDFNTIPPGTIKVKDFPDSKCEGGDFEGGDYSQEIGWLDELYDDYQPAVALEKYQQPARQARYFSFGDKPDSLGFTRKLDYLFTNLAWVPGSDSTHQDIASPGRTLSDHCPVSVRITLP